MNHGEIVSFIWGVADLIRDTFKRGKYQDVILPLTVLRRLDCVLAPTKEKVLTTLAKYKGKGLENVEPLLRKSSGFAFYNTSRYDFEKLLADAPNVAANLGNYIKGFSPNMQEVLEKFDFDNTISKLAEAGLLFKVLERFKNVDLHPDKVPNPMMGTIFEELIRRFNEALNENPGEHFTPRDVVHLMVDLLLAGDEGRIRKPNVVLTVYDPCCGSGGMLTIAKDHIAGTVTRSGVNPRVEVHLFGQEVNPETWAVSKSDMLMLRPDGHDADNIEFGSTLSNDRHARRKFDYLITNPPYGKDWKRDQEAVEKEHERGLAGRFGAGLPRISDGQILFLQHMLAHMKPPGDGGSRVAIIMNGSPLFTGDAGGGESEIRRWILENDWLEALIAMPEQLFYNTGIATYVWVLTNRKARERKGKVQIVDATSFWAPMRRSLGDKRREIPPEKAAEILAVHREFKFKEGEFCKIFPTTHFGYRKITVERPLRLNFQASKERIARLDDESGFQNLARSAKKDPKARAREEGEGRALQEAIRKMLAGMPDTLFKDREKFTDAVTKSVRPSAHMKDPRVGWISEIPAHWDMRRLKFATSFVTSGSRGWAQHYSDEGAIFLRIGNLSRTGIELQLDDVQYVDPPAGAEGRRTKVEPGDLLVSITAYIGSVGVAPEGIGEAYVNQHLALARLRREVVEPRWAAYCLLSHVGQPQLRLLLYGGTKDGLGLDDVKALELLVPPLAEQSAIVRAIDKDVARIDELVAKVRDGIRQLKEYRVAVISAAVTGRIDVRGEVAS